ncbi:DUF308 domain-containing protein [Candidatus Saccharibacteria bacterium]|nr:DUF308 domain-containing protein [Candidatus Saccharibacteria bacterium]
MAKPKSEVIKRPIEQIGGDLKMTAWSSIFGSIALIILGILCIVWPDTIVKILAYILGVFFIIRGAYNIINYFIVGGQRDFFNNSLLSGVVAVLIGIAALLIGENIAGIFRIVLGILIIYESLVRINTASKLASVGVDSWRYIVCVALIMLVLGIFVTFNSGAVVTLIGWIMIVTGIIGIVGDAVFISHVNTVVDAVTGEKSKNNPSK